MEDENNNNNMIEITFSYIDELGEESTLKKTIASNKVEDGDYTGFDLLVEEFKNFMLGSGFSSELVNTIQIVENSEE